MKLKYVRGWALLLAAAFLVLWCVSIAVTYSASAQEPLQQEQQGAGQVSVVYTQNGDGIRAVGILGWCLVGIGLFGVAFTMVWEDRPHRRPRTVYGGRRRRRPGGRSLPSRHRPPYYPYKRNIERRF